MRLKQSLFNRFYEALLDAFDEADLRVMLQLHLDRDFDRITHGRNLRERTVSLIRWAEKTDKVPRLIEGACEYNPDNRLLQRLRTDVDRFTLLIAAADGHGNQANGNGPPPTQENRITDFITPSEPFGPIDSSEIKGVDNMERLFDQHNRLFRHLQDRPAVILGRKGSGKTAYLNSVYFYADYDYVIELGTPFALQQIVEAVQRCIEGTAFSEAVAELWEQFLWLGIFVVLREKITEQTIRDAVNAYLGALQIGETRSSDEGLRDMVQMLQERAGGVNVHQLIAAIERPNDGSESSLRFSETRAIVEQWLRARNRQAVILMDSLDDFQLDAESVGHALRGLLKCVGQFNSANSVIDVRFCLPSELSHRFMLLSSNPNKDFRRKLILHWTAKELLLMGAQRLAIYLKHYEAAAYERLDAAKIMRRKDAAGLFEAVLPPSTANAQGSEEATLAYILRHTQLLPRHLLILLNSIFSRWQRYEDTDFNVTAEDVQLGIDMQAPLLVQEIFSAYQNVYPCAHDVCVRCLPELPHVFSQGELRRVFRRHGKTAMGNDDFFEFRTLLIEIGAVGRVQARTDRYIVGEFEYTVPDRLHLSTDDDLCVHPLFSHVFRTKPCDALPIYPYGTNVDDPDMRVFSRM